MAELNDYGLPVRQRDRMDQDVDVEKAAQQEQARRILARRRLLPFILRNDPEFDAAMFHKLVTWRLEKFSEQVANGESPRLIIQAPPRHGKLMADDTPVLTTEGWKTHGGLQIGDYVYHPSGKPVAVLAVSEKQPADWRVDVSSDESFYCHGSHEWTVYDRRYAEPVTIETRQFRQHITEVDYQLPFSLGLGLVDDHRVLTVAAVEHDPRGKFGHCIQVDSEDGLYLVGKTLVPTHNSELVSRNFPAWHLGRYPDHEFIACSYGSDLARDFSRKVRGLLLDEGYQALFPDVELDPDSRAVDRWNIDGHRGGYVASGVGGPITGRGLHVGVIDDYVKNWEEADNESSREKLWNWYESTFKSRLAPGGGIIIMATRWHHDDLIGRVLEQDGDAKDGGDWDVMSFSAIAEADEYTDDGVLFRHKGEALHAARYPVEFFDQFKKNPRVYWSLYQQKPMVEGGNFFKQEAFKWYRSVERPELEDLTIISTWDFAVGQKEQNDFTVGCVGGIDRNFKVWALDQVRGHWDSMETVEKIIEIYRMWQPDMWGFEHGQISLAIAPFLNRRMVEESIWDIDIEDSAMKTGRRDKVARAKPLQGFIRTGHFLFPSEAEWKKTMMDEFLVFPAGEHDDQVDAWAWMAQRAEDFISKGVVPKKSRPRGRYEKTPWRERLSRELAGQSGGSWRTA